LVNIFTKSSRVYPPQFSPSGHAPSSLGAGKICAKQKFADKTPKHKNTKTQKHKNNFKYFLLNIKLS
ncbi:hypothetical protein KKH38_00285, partial [Patescibacteria group bacterium]|nr:hypothetical protein [Patescibacteria group bacterium]